MSDRLFIVSGNHDEFLSYKNTLDAIDAIYVSSIHVLKGSVNIHGKFIGTWYKRVDIPTVVLYLASKEAISPDLGDYIMSRYHELRG